MELTVLGAGPAYTNVPGSTGAAYLVRADGGSILLDLGQGSFPALASRMDPRSLGAVFVSHLHPDHFIDLVPLRHYLRYHVRPPDRVAVFAPRGIDSRLDALHAEDGFTAEALDVHPVEEVMHIGPFEVRSGHVTHLDESYAYRVSEDGGDGPGLVYSGDVGRHEDLIALIRPGDTLLVEVSFGSGPVSPGAQHLNAEAVAALAEATRPGRVLLTHLQMGFDRDETVEAVRRGWNGPVEIVSPGYVTQVPA